MAPIFCVNIRAKAVYSWSALLGRFFQPAVGIADEILSILLYVPVLLLHVYGGVRWGVITLFIFDDQTSKNHAGALAL